MDLKQQNDNDLTNLNWVSGTAVPMNVSLSPPSSTNKNSYGDKKSQNWLDSEMNQKRSPYIQVDAHGNKKPLCSYSCLIALALRAATTAETGACLPVHEVYSCIEELFPFYKNTADGWKNSVRHNLSLNQSFRKVLRDEGWEGKKGYFWEICPDKMEALNQEMDKLLAMEGRTLDSMRATLLLKWVKPAPVKRKSTSTGRKTSKSTIISSKEAEPEEIPRDPSEIAIYSPQMQAQLKRCKTPVTPKTEHTRSVFDTSNAPSEFAGIQTPQSDDIGAAKELFSCGSTSETDSPHSMYMHTNRGEFVPLTTTPMYGMYGLPTMAYSYGTPSPIMGVSPASSEGTSPFVSPPVVPLVPIGMFAPCVMNFSHQPRSMIASTCKHCGQQNNPFFPWNTGSKCQDEEDPLAGDEHKCKRKSCSSCCKGTKRKKTPKTPRKKVKPSKCKGQLDSKQDDQEPKCDPVSVPSTSSSEAHATSTKMSQEDSFIDIESDQSHEVAVPSTKPIDNDIEIESEEVVHRSHLFKGLSAEKVDQIEIKSLLTGASSSLQASSDSNPTTDSQTASPFKATSVLSLGSITGEESAATSYGIPRQVADNSDGIPALHSLLDMGDASIVSIEAAMNLA